MPRMHDIVAALCVLVLACGCAPASQDAGQAPQDAGVAAATDVRSTPERTESHASYTRHARGFDVVAHGALRLVTVRGPVRSWSRGGEPVSTTQRIALVPSAAGAAAPALPAGWEDAVVVRVPVRRIAVNSQPEEAYLAQLSASDRLVAVGGGKSYDDAVRARVQRGELGQVGYSWHSPPNLDVLVDRAPDVFVMRLSDLDHAPALVRANALGIPTVPYFVDAETTYLGRAEWVRFFALLVGKEAEGDALFARIEASTAAIVDRAGAMPAVPVLWAYASGADRWQAVVRGPEAALLRDAGGQNLLAEPEDAMRDVEVPIATEVLLARGAEARCWIAGDIHAAPVRDTAMLARIRAWREGCLLSNAGRTKAALDAYDYYELGFVRPDLLLADLFALLHPAAATGKAPGFFVRIPPAALGQRRGGAA